MKKIITIALLAVSFNVNAQNEYWFVETESELRTQCIKNSVAAKRSLMFVVSNMKRTRMDVFTFKNFREHSNNITKYVNKCHDTMTPKTRASFITMASGAGNHMSKVKVKQ